MVYAKLTYARNLNQERRRLEENRRKEYRKRTANRNKLNRIESTLKEVQEESQRVSREISEWLENVELPFDIKDQMFEYFVNGRPYYDDNFFRYVMTPFGENR